MATAANCERFEIYRAKSGRWHWRLRARNGRVIADGAEGYSTKTNAERAAVRAAEVAFIAEIITPTTKGAR
jgi:uncharacterized protein YegP (UPF0339 family)